jgi:hypothetical protein
MGAPTSSYATASIALRVSGALKPHHDKVETPSVGIYHIIEIISLGQIMTLSPLASVSCKLRYEKFCKYNVEYISTREKPTHWEVLIQAGQHNSHRGESDGEYSRHSQPSLQLSPNSFGIGICLLILCLVLENYHSQAKSSSRRTDIQEILGLLWNLNYHFYILNWIVSWVTWIQTTHICYLSDPLNIDFPYSSHIS